MIRFWYWLKYFLLGVSLSLLITLSQPSLILAQKNNEVQQNQAELLTQKGHKQLNQGQATEAYDTWKQAAKLYSQLHDSEGVIGSSINQNLALQALGLYPRACKTVLEALKMDRWICDSSSKQSDELTTEKLKAAIEKVKITPVNLLALHNLGDTLRLIGKLNESVVVLQSTLSLVQQLTPEKDTSKIKLSLIVSEHYIYDSARDRYDWIEEPVYQRETVNFIQKQALKLLNDYQPLIDTPTAPIPIKLQAQLQRLSLLLDFEKWLTAESNLGNTQLVDIETQINQQIQPSVELILENPSAFSDLPATQSIYTKLNFANSLNQIPEERLHLVAVQYAQSALQTAKSTNEQRLKSYAFGTLGKLEKQPKRSLYYLEQAMALAQSIQAWDIAYEWQHELGLEYCKQGKFDKALEAYSAAINNLTRVRDNLLESNVDLQFSFYEKVEPVYREYMRLLLSSPTPNLELVIQTNEQLQIVELENFLRCKKLDLIALNKIQNLNNLPTVIHIIDLGERTEVFVQSVDKFIQRHSVESKLLKDHLNNLLKNLQDKNLVDTDEHVLLIPSQALYNLLIAPIKKYLPSSGTLVFILDKSFQSLPMGLLNDGQDYLIKQYSVTETLGSRIRPPKSLAQEQLKALIAGLSKTSPSFNDPNAPKGVKALPEVEAEVRDIKKQTKQALSLLNEKFTSERFEREFTTADFPIVHITTHGQFSSDPQRTVILAWDQAINVLEFDKLLKAKTESDANAIELLVLSACQTAKGNHRSTLGIAGVAAQAGARSTIASLWLVDAESTASLMEQFYKGLRNGIPKAEALRLAQLSLLSNPEYRHPYYWASFLLIGSWL